MLLAGDRKLHTTFFHKDIGGVEHSGLSGAVPNTDTCVAAHCCGNFLLQILETLQYVYLFLLFYLLIFLEMNKIMMYL